MTDDILAKKNTAMRMILENHLLALFRDRPKCEGRRSFCAVIRQGGFKVVRSRELKCCDIVIFETSLRPQDKVSRQIIEKCLDLYIKWELKF